MGKVAMKNKKINMDIKVKYPPCEWCYYIFFTSLICFPLWTYCGLLLSSFIATFLIFHRVIIGVGWDKQQKDIQESFEKEVQKLKDNHNG